MPGRSKATVRAVSSWSSLFGRNGTAPFNGLYIAIVPDLARPFVMPNSSDLTDPNSVLIVDDEPANVTLLTQALNGMNLRLLAAHSGKDALAQLDTAPVDLILLDAIMPGMSGFEVTQTVRARKSDEILPIVIVTALDSPED